MATTVKIQKDQTAGTGFPLEPLSPTAPWKTGQDIRVAEVPVKHNLRVLAPLVCTHRETARARRAQRTLETNQTLRVNTKQLFTYGFLYMSFKLFKVIYALNMTIQFSSVNLRMLYIRYMLKSHPLFCLPTLLFLVVYFL